MGFDLTEKGVPSVNTATCTGCGACVAACPDQVLALDRGKAFVRLGKFMGCIACGHCIAACPTGSVAVIGRGMTPDDAIALPPREQRANADQFEALLLARRSIRRFTPQEVDRAAVDRILAMISTAPMGIPPSDVGVLVFHGRDKVQGFAQDACDAFKGMAWFFRPVVLGLMRPMLGRENYLAMRDFVRPLLELLMQERSKGVDCFTYDAPLAMLFHHGPMADAADASIAATYAMLAAESLGLGSCLLGTTAGLNHAKAFKAKHRIPPKNKIGLGLVIGHSAETFRHAVRRRLANVAG
jgi:ferredoxin